MSSFHDVMDYARAQLPGIAADIEYDPSTSLKNRASVMNAVTELMRRINYVPSHAVLGGPRKHWVATLSGDHMLDPKRAASAYRKFTDDMNDDMVNDLLHTLQVRVAKAAGVAPPSSPEMRSDDPAEEVVVPVAAPAPVLGEALEAVIARLLEETPLDNEAWAAW